MHLPHISRGTRRLLREIGNVVLIIAAGALVWFVLAWSAAVSI
ncbi:hypothetical protein [Nocardia sp. SC052]